MMIGGVLLRSTVPPLGDRVTFEMDSEAMIVQGWSMRLCKLGDALGCHNRVNLEAVIKRVWRYTWRL